MQNRTNLLLVILIGFGLLGCCAVNGYNYLRKPPTKIVLDATKSRIFTEVVPNLTEDEKKIWIWGYSEHKLLSGYRVFLVDIGLPNGKWLYNIPAEQLLVDGENNQIKHIGFHGPSTKNEAEVYDWAQQIAEPFGWNLPISQWPPKGEYDYRAGFIYGKAETINNVNYALNIYDTYMEIQRAGGDGERVLSLSLLITFKD